MSEQRKSPAEDHAAQLQGAQFAAVINSTRDAVITVDQAGRITLFNPAAQAMFGYTPWEAMGKPLELLIPKRFRPAAENARGNAKRTSIQYFRASPEQRIVLRGDGTEFLVTAVLSEVEVAGEEAYVLILREIS